MHSDFDVVFVGGGLSTSLCVLALLERKPHLRIAVIERDERLGGNHTWCFHAADLPQAAQGFVEQLVVRRWPRYSVLFPRRTRSVESAYACISSERLHEVVTARARSAPSCTLLLATHAERVEATRVCLRDGRELRAPLVVEATGPSERPQAEAGYQKFVGLELSLGTANAPREPILFDARIAQRDGFRFMYVLPLAPDRVLIEETFFSETNRLDEQQSEAAILAYATELGLDVRAVTRRERGILPMPWRDADFDPAARPLQAGYGGGLFHPVTGYSFPLAVRFALALAESDLHEGARAVSDSPLHTFAAQHAAQRPFLRLLTRLLFTCFAPAQRFSVLEHFYRLPEPVIERFYSADLTALDRARIFWGAPPRGFSLARALRQHRAEGVAP
jgi:lycopene beta-cyclase